MLSASLRRMEDVILDQLINQPGVLNAPGLLQRFNSGSAWSASLELELRGRLRHAWVAAAPLRWQASMGLTRSRLDDVDAERPALAGQAPWHVKLDLTQPLATGWTAQLGMEARGPARADLPSGRRIETETRRSLNAGLSWQPRPHQTWRVSVAQIAATDHVDLKTVRVVQDGEPVVYRSREAWHRDLLWRVGLDSRF